MKRSSVKTTSDLSRISVRLNVLLGEALSNALDSQESNPFPKNLSFSLAREKDVIVKELLTDDSLTLKSTSGQLNYEIFAQQAFPANNYIFHQ